jgi:hypothetical protein
VAAAPSKLAGAMHRGDEGSQDRPRSECRLDGLVEPVPVERLPALKIALPGVVPSHRLGRIESELLSHGVLLLP